MKRTPGTIRTALNTALPTHEGALDFFVLITIEFADDMDGNPRIRRLTDLPHNIEIGGLTYTSDGGITQYSPPSLTSVVDRETYRITIEDREGGFAEGVLADEFRTLLRGDDTVGTPVTVQMGIVTAAGPQTAELDTVYKGRIDGAEFTTDFQDGSRRVVIECSSPFADLDLVRLRMTSEAYQKTIDQTDTAFDELYKRTEQIELGWGKK